MIEDKPKGLRVHLPILYPAVMLVVFFVIPFGIMLAVSFFQREPGGFYTTDFSIDNYANLFTVLFGRVLVFSIFISALCAAICVAVGFPFTYFITRMRRKAQVVWLVILVSVLSLSAVIVAFAWSLLLSQTAGISNLFVWLGLMEKPVSWSPGFWALTAGMCYIAFPYTVLVLYPPLSRLDPHLPEAAQTLGASPVTTFFTVVLGSLRSAIVATLIMVFAFTLGTYLIPQILGRPQHWTLSVLITDEAVYHSNLPLAAAMAVFFMVVSLALVGLATLIGKSGANHSMNRSLRQLFLALVLIFLASPIVVVGGVWLNERGLYFPPQGFSLNWYVELFTESAWLIPIENSMIIATLSVSRPFPSPCRSPTFSSATECFTPAPFSCSASRPSCCHQLSPP